jgi:aminopeptidase N
MWFKRHFIILGILLPACSYAELPVLQHDLAVEFDHKNRTFSVRDQISLHNHDTNDGQTFPDLSLNPDLRVDSVSVDGLSVEASFNNGFFDVPDYASEIELVYSGELNDSQWPYFVWLPGDGWYPEAADHRVRFSLSLKADPQWSALTQGTPITQSDDKDRRWIQADPQEGIFLVIGPWQRYNKELKGYRANVMLIEPDPELAQRYLDATLEYMAEYSRLIGPYPYHSFTLVENVRQTGWGMPGFTLLGSRVIRLPFILHTSYPHEILHNWWGNGVFVDPSFGNWSEGLTTYLSDYRSRERRGEASQYRLNALISWQDFAAEKEDFPLMNFRGRHNRATQAVGYGKGMFLFHMLRQKLGDRLFFSALEQLYAEFKYRLTSFMDVKSVFEQVCDCDLNAFFEQWLHRTGAPTLTLDSVRVSAASEPNSVSITLSQSSEKPWDILVPIHTIDMTGNRSISRVRLNTAEHVFKLDRDTSLEGLEVDPEFDLFRTLDPGEKPATLSTIFAAKSVAVVALDDSLGPVAKQLADKQSNWQLIAADSADVDSAEALVLLGWNPDLVAQRWVTPESPDYQIDYQGIEIDQVEYPMDSARVIALTSEIIMDGRTKPMLWIAAKSSQGIVDLVRRLSHYGRYSWAVFDSPESRASKTGQWKPKANSLTWKQQSGMWH